MKAIFIYHSGLVSVVLQKQVGTEQNFLVE